MLTDVLKLKRPLVCVDAETTGANPRVDRIWQLAVLKFDIDGSLKEWSSLFNPTVPVPAHMLERKNLTQQQIDTSPPFAKHAKGLAVGFANCDFAGFNVPGDLECLAAEFRRSNIVFEPGSIVDAFRIFTYFEPRTLTAAVKKYLDEDHLAAHDALADARATARVIEAQLKLYGTGLPDTPAELHEKFFSLGADKLDRKGRLIWRGGEAVISFGKHVGKPLKGVPTEYLEWMCSESFEGEEDLKVIIRKALAGQFPQRSEV
jgi:DNA polymerase III epsilon subunit-like protein